MPELLHRCIAGIFLTAGMAWKSGWSLVLGFAISAALQVLTPTDHLRRALGRASFRSIALASAAGAASSSCSYASASIMRTLFKKGTALAPSLAFLIASTNLVLELGIIIWLLMGWRFMVAEWIGGVVLILIVSAIVHLLFPAHLIEEARSHEGSGHTHDHGNAAIHGKTWREKLRDPQAIPMIGSAFVMEWRMLWKDLLAGFLIGGILASFVPPSFWQSLFLADAPGWLRIPADALIGPLVAMLTFVCSIGNVPLAAMLWSGGASFGGVIAFLYADLIVLPLLDSYRRFFGGRMAAAIGATLFASMVIAAVIVSLGFAAVGLDPMPASGFHGTLTGFSIDYTFWLNMIALLFAGWLVWKGGRGSRAHEYSGGSQCEEQ